MGYSFSYLYDDLYVFVGSYCRAEAQLLYFLDMGSVVISPKRGQSPNQDWSIEYNYLLLIMESVR